MSANFKRNFDTMENIQNNSCKMSFKKEEENKLLNKKRKNGELYKITDFFKLQKVNVDQKITKPVDISSCPSCLNTKEKDISSKTKEILDNLNKYKNKNNLKSSSPNIQLVKKHKINHDDVQNILNELSMRQKYEGLLKKELILPSKYKELQIKFNNLDEAIKTLKTQKQKISINNIDSKLNEKNAKINFTQDDFEQILFIVPHFFIYKWENNNNNYELTLDIPTDIQQRIKVYFIFKF